MRNAIIIYGSTTGNTEFTAETIEESLSGASYAVKTLNVSDTDVDILGETYDLYVLGCSTWGHDEIELQEDFEPFFEDMNGNLSLDGKKFAVFGCGDSSYEYFCGAVDVIEERIQKLGGSVVCNSLRIDGEPEETEISEWAQDVVNAA